MFDDESKNVAIPPSDLLKINILNIRQWALDSLADYKKHYYLASNSAPSHVARSRIYEFYLCLFASLKEDLKSSEFDDIKNLIDSGHIEDMIIGFERIDSWLYTKGVTKFDNIKRYDFTRAEKENAVKRV